MSSAVVLKLHKSSDRGFFAERQTQNHEMQSRGFIKGRAPGKLTGCEHDFARLLYISKNFFLIQGTINNSFKLQSCPFLDESYRV